MTYDVITIGLIISWVLVAVWVGRIFWEREDARKHARLVGLGLRPMDDRMRKYAKYQVPREEFEIGQILASRKKRIPIKPYIKGIPRHLQQ